MRLVLFLFVMFSVAAAVGLGLTAYAVDHGPLFARLTVGAWVASPNVGGVEIDPYARAAYARRGEAPLASVDGLAFRAVADDEGRALAGDCDYRIEGRVPVARFWTIAVHAPDGSTFDTPADRHAFTDREVVRRPDGSFVITIAPKARPGNWLPVAANHPFVIVTRLYDTTTGNALLAREAPEMPKIIRGACR